MPVLIALLRGINLGGHHRIKMDALRALCESLGLRDVQTYLQSGNVVFRVRAGDTARLRKKMEAAIEREFGFRADVALRTPAELKEAARRNPFVSRPGMELNKCAVHFLCEDPETGACDALRKIETAPEELHLEGREVYIYFANGMARPKLSMALIERTLKVSGTSRNLNTVRNVLEMAERMAGTTSGT